MITKYNIHDILTYNKQGVFAVGIVVKITIVDNAQGCLYMLDNGLEVLEENITSYLGNAETISELGVQ